MILDIIYYSWVGLFIIFALIQGVQWLQSRKIKNRFKKFVSFNDYERFKYLINPKFNKIIIYFSNGLFLMTLIMLATSSVIDFSVYRYYFYMLIPLVISDASIIFHEYSRKYHQLELEEVDVAYYKIDGIITNTDSFIKERRHIIKDISQYMQDTQKELAPLLGKSSSTLFRSIIEDLNEKKSNLQGKIDNLYEDIEELKLAFVDTLNKKLRNEEANFKKIFKSKSVDSYEKSPEDEMLEIKISTEEKITQAIDSYVAIASSLLLVEVKVIFQTYTRFSENIPTPSIINVLEKMNLETIEYDEFIEAFYAIPMDSGEVFKKYFIPNDIQWIYSPLFNQKLSPPQKRAIYKELIKQKATRSLEKILAQLDPVTLSEVDELSHIAEVDSVVLSKINRYQRITERLYQSFNALNAPENLYLILQQSQNTLPETQQFIRSNPIQNTDLNQLSETIFEIYHQEFNQISFEIISIIETLDAFKALNNNNRSLFNWGYLENFILENAGRLNLNDVYLGFGLFLVDLEKTNLLVRIDELASQDQDRFQELIQRFDSSRTLDLNRIKESGKWDKNILGHPRISRFKDRLPTIIMRVENQRMTLSNLSI